MDNEQVDERFERQFTERFNRAFEESVRQHELIPNAIPSWENIQKKVYKKLARKNKNQFRLKLLPYIAVSFLLGAYLFGTPLIPTAYAFIKSAISINDHVDQQVQDDQKSSPKPRTAPPPDYYV